jgi:hypothetical protein
MMFKTLTLMSSVTVMVIQSLPTVAIVARRRCDPDLSPTVSVLFLPVNAGWTHEERSAI